MMEDLLRSFDILEMGVHQTQFTMSNWVGAGALHG
jgi:hypothetical protein